MFKCFLVPMPVVWQLFNRLTRNNIIRMISNKGMSAGYTDETLGSAVCAILTIIVYMCVYIYIYIYIHTHKYVYICLYVYVYVCFRPSPRGARPFLYLRFAYSTQDFRVSVSDAPLSTSYRSPPRTTYRLKIRPDSRLKFPEISSRKTAAAARGNQARI